MNGTTQGIELLDALQMYFQGEKTEALVFILPVGLLSLVFGAWLLTDNPGSFARGVALPFLVMGLLMSVVGGTVGYRTPAQEAGIKQSLQANPQAALRMEAQRMNTVNKAWPIYLAMWGVCAVLGLLMRFVVPSDFFQGMGIALVFCAGLGLLVDGFAQRRTHPYVDALERSALKIDLPM